MKYLKIFESKTCKDYFDELNSKTGVDGISPELDELFLELKDEFKIDNRDTTGALSDLNIIVTYKRQRERKSSLRYFYFRDLFKEGRREPNKTETNSIKQFLEHCEIASDISFEYWKEVGLIIDNEEEFERIKVEINSILERARSMEYRSNIGRSKGKYYTLYSNSTWLGDFEDLDSYYEDGLRRTTSRYLRIWFKFEGEIDKSRLLSSNDLDGQIPQNILTDFNEFANKLRMSQSDKQSLINIIKRGDWSVES
jgi:hypothetical protein